MAVFCQRCGTGLPEGARFCSSCGAVFPSGPALHSRQAAGPPDCGPPDRRGLHRRGAGLWLGCRAGSHRLAVIGLFFSGGLVFVAYLAGWIGIPEEPVLLPELSS
jgi:phage shock protein C